MEAVLEAAIAEGQAALANTAAVPMVKDMLVPVSPSGTGKTFRSLMACFWALMEAEPWITMR